MRCGKRLWAGTTTLPLAKSAQRCKRFLYAKSVGKNFVHAVMLGIAGGDGDGARVDRHLRRDFIHGVAKRQREIGIRLALGGGAAWEVLQMILKHGAADGRGGRGALEIVGAFGLTRYFDDQPAFWL